MLLLGKRAKTLNEGARKIADALDSGAALERFLRCVQAQGGDPRLVEHPERLAKAKRQAIVRASRAGIVAGIDAGLVGRGATLLGAGRQRKEDVVDPGVAVILACKVGAEVRRGDPLATVFYSDERRWAEARGLLESAFRIGKQGPRPLPLVLQKVASG
jgi:thymidine phosphorylase